MRIYVETNFLIGAARGQDASASHLLEFCRTGVGLAIPEGCFMEAFSKAKREDRRIQQLIRELEEEVRSARRDVLWKSAPGRVPILERAQGELLAGHQTFLSRLLDVASEVSEIATLIPITTTVLEAARNSPAIEDPTDNVILATVLDHAARLPDRAMAFLSGNRRDFGNNTYAGDGLRGAGVRYFSEAGPLLAWARAVNRP